MNEPTEENELEKYERFLKLSYNPNTIRQYLMTFKVSSNYFGSQEGIERFLLSKFSKKTGSINAYYYGFLKSVIECFDLPFKIPKSKKKKSDTTKIYKFLTKEEVDRIILNGSPYVSLLVQLYFETGLRLMELISTRKEDVDILNRTITGKGKGNKDFIVKFSMDMQKKLINRLNECKIKERPFVEMKEIKLKEGKLTWEPYKAPQRHFQYVLKKECEKLDIHNVTPHKLRHALGHYLRADKGFDLMQVKEKLRHSDISTTQIYAPATQEEVDAKIDKEVFDNN